MSAFLHIPNTELLLMIHQGRHDVYRKKGRGVFSRFVT